MEKASKVCDAVKERFLVTQMPISAFPSRAACTTSIRSFGKKKKKKRSINMLINTVSKTKLEKVWIELSRIQVTWMPFSICKASSGDSCLNTFYQTVLASTLVFSVVCWDGNIKGEDGDRISKLEKKK